MNEDEGNRVLEEAAYEFDKYRFPEEWECNELDEHEAELAEKVRTGAMSADEAIYRYCKARPVRPEAVIQYAEERLGYSAYHAALKEIAAAFDGKDISGIIDYLYWFDT